MRKRNECDLVYILGVRFQSVKTVESMRLSAHENGLYSLRGIVLIR